MPATYNAAMSAAYRRLLARPRPQDGKDSASSVVGDPRRLREWRDALPLANTASAGRSLLEHVRALDVQRVPPQRRLDALEQLRPVLAQLTGALDRQVIGGGFPLSAQQAALGDLAGALQDGFAGACRAVLVDLTGPDGTMPFLRGRMVAQAAVRALQHGVGSLAHACLLYQVPARGAWQELHDLHALAVELGVDAREVPDTAGTGVSSAHGCYLQALLFAVANPYAFSQREQLEVAMIARALAPHARLSASADGGVAVPVDRDRGPGYASHERDAAAPGDVSLDVSKALSVAGELLARTHGAQALVMHLPDGTPFEVDGGLLRRVLANLAVRGEREHARIGGGHALATVIGLHDVHAVLAGPDARDPFEQHLGSPLGPAAAARWQGTSIRSGAPRVARVLDQALGGYRLLWQGVAGGEGTRARVGEVVGLALPASGGADWMVGAIRWLRIDGNGGIECGIQLLARRALAAWVRLPEEPSRILSGVLLADLDATPLDGYAGLLVSTELDREPAALEVATPEDTSGLPRAAGHLRVDHPALEASGIAYRIFRMP